MSTRACGHGEMVYPPSSYGIQSLPPYDQRRLIGQNPSPAYLGFTSSSLAYSHPQIAGGEVCYGVPSALAYHPGISQNCSASRPPFYPHQLPFATSAAVYHSRLQGDYVHGPTIYDLSPRSGRSNIRALGKQPHAAEQVLGKMIVDGSKPTALKQSDSTSKPHSVANLTPAISNNFNRPDPSRRSLWVGNVPLSASLLDLKDHFSRHATENIESVLLINQSNCAFVNYRSVAACAAALSRYHGSEFQGSRLVCKLQKGNSEVISNQSRSPRSYSHDGASVNKNVAPRSADRYFVMKSFTKEELETSRQSGIWATQAHNEINLNKAFESSQQVYLIFSANKSGEYFGYARMLSAIDDTEIPRNLPLFNPRDDHQNGLDVTLTCATAVAPKGRMIRDFAKNIMVWEADSLEDESMSGNIGVKVRGTEAYPLGRPFRIQWLSDKRVPFQRTHKLRNPWNSNRLVKIARDGTEIEPTVARKLVRLFQDE